MSFAFESCQCETLKLSNYRFTVQHLGLGSCDPQSSHHHINLICCVSFVAFCLLHFICCNFSFISSASPIQASVFLSRILPYFRTSFILLQLFCGVAYHSMLKGAKPCLCLSMQLTSELEDLQQQLFQHKQLGRYVACQTRLKWAEFCLFYLWAEACLCLCMQLTSELEGLQQQLFQQKQQVLSLTAQNDAMQSELESSRTRLQGEAERSAFHQQQLDAERKLRIQHSEQVCCPGFEFLTMLCLLGGPLLTIQCH